MVDRYDKSYTRKPAPSESGTPQSPDDPLVELARIVSGNPSFDDLVGRPAQQPAPARPAPRSPTRDLSFDLESELLNDLQTSFDPAARAAAPRQAPSQPAAPRPAAQPAGPPPRDDFDHMRLRPGQPQAPGWNSAPDPIDDDPYAGTAYSPNADYDRSMAADPLPASRGFSRTRVSQPIQEEPLAGGYEEEDYYDEAGEPPYDESDYGDDRYTEYDGYDAEPPRRSRKVLIGIAAVLAVVLAGGVAALALRGQTTGSSSSGPAVIAADDSPTKVEPAAQPVEQDGQQNKLIYDRANPDASPEEQLVLPDDGAIDTPPPSTESAASREISRIILPGAPGDNSTTPATPDSASTSLDPSAEPAEGDAVPLKVRTVVIKPDGTIVSSEARAKDAPESAAPAVAANDTSVAETQPVPVPEATEAPPPASEPLPAAPVEEAAPPPPAASQKDPSQLAAPKVAASPKPAERPAQVASAPATGGFVVQVTAQRSEDQAAAAFRTLQRKYPSILGSRSPNIVRADLGAKGIYYRARVGPMATRDEAISLCEALKAAGGDCLVQKN